MLCNKTGWPIWAIANAQLRSNKPLGLTNNQAEVNTRGAPFLITMVCS
jgi:hypothetical protein